MRGTKPSLAPCATFCESFTPSNRRTATYMALAYLLHIEGGPRRPCLKLINVSSVKGYKGWRNFGECPKPEVGLPRIPIPRTPVNKGLLDCLLSLPGRIGTQPQRDVCGLHRLPYHPHQVFAQGVQVCFVAQLGREGF